MPKRIDPLDMLWFGKYKNVPIEDVPTDYLQWAIDTWEPGTAQYEMVEKEYLRRKGQIY